MSMLWWHWLVVGLLLMLGELVTPGGFYIIFFGIGAVLVGLLASVGAAGPTWTQVLLFSLFSVALPDIWLTTSFITLVLFAGLQNIPGDVIEAARIDGANYWRLLISVIIPLLRPVIAVALIVRGIDAARAFDIIIIQTDGGPQGSTTTLSLLIYRTLTRFGDPGLASAMGTVYLIAMLSVSLVAIALIWRPGGNAR